jgi:tetratricopeptide (TPR) repeat protein
MKKKIEVEVLSHIYWVMALIVLTAASSLTLDHNPIMSIFLLGIMGLLILAAKFETISFDSKLVIRKGFLAFLETFLSGQKPQIALDQIEMVATEAIRSRRGLRNVKYLYKVAISGNGIQLIVIVNGAKKNSDRHSLIKELFNCLPETKLDPRSSELKQYLNDLPSNNALLEIAETAASPHLEEAQIPPILLLRRAANSLKLEGQMQKALKCFTLAYKNDPKNAQLLYEMARFFRSLAMIDSPRLLSRSRACLRLAAFLAKNEPHLLERIGETYFERLDYKLAAKCFSSALVAEPMLYRANVGLAEIALRDGKLAHVAHFYSAAASVSRDRAQKELASREADYYGRLCSDEDYFEAEINRINKLKSFQWARDWSSLLLIASWMLALFTGLFSTNLGIFAWSIVFSSSLVWLGSILFSFHYSQRYR